jgi:hypothetical protein
MSDLFRPLPIENVYFYYMPIRITLTLCETLTYLHTLPENSLTLQKIHKLEAVEFNKT